MHDCYWSPLYYGVIPLCEFCTKHGEGKKWYEIMEHYSLELLNDPGRQVYIKNFVSGINFEVLTPSQAKDILRAFDRQGLVHSIWTFKTPFIGAICNCDRDCLAYRFQVSSDLTEIMFKSEYLAHIDIDLCVGCRSCMSFCQFGAIEYSTADVKCYINPDKCYGCGVCRNTCKTQAIKMDERF